MKYFIIILLIVFGPKFGFLDLSFFTSFFVIILNFKRLRSLNKITFFFPLLLILLIITITSLSNIFSISDFDSSIILRYFRALVGFFAAYVISSNLTRKKLINTIQLLLILNSIIVILQILFPVLHDSMAIFTGYNKKYIPFRGFGLTNGYDIAGLFTTIGLLISIKFPIFNKKLSKLIINLIFIVSAVFISRLTTFSVLLITLWLLFNKYKLILPILSFVLFFTLYLDFFNLHTQLIHYYDLLLSVDITQSYSSSSVDLLRSMFIIPDDTLSLFLGDGSNPFYVDIGYVKIIFMHGLVGLIVIISFYLGLYSIVRSADRVVFKNLFLWIIFLTFIFNFKNLFFFSRGIFEITMMFYFTILIYKNENKKRIFT